MYCADIWPMYIWACCFVALDLCLIHNSIICTNSDGEQCELVTGYCYLMFKWQSWLCAYFNSCSWHTACSISSDITATPVSVTYFNSCNVDNDLEVAIIGLPHPQWYRVENFKHTYLYCGPKWKCHINYSCGYIVNVKCFFSCGFLRLSCFEY